MAQRRGGDDFLRLMRSHFVVVKSPKDLRTIERGAFDRLKALDAPTLEVAVGN